jgi:hypothetical protein
MSSTKATIERYRPAHLHNKPHFTSMVTSEGGKTIYISGLVASEKAARPFTSPVSSRPIPTESWSRRAILAGS